MDWIQVFTIIGSLIGGLIYIHTDLTEFKRDVKEDIKSLNARTDRLYEMFIDLLRERK